SSPTTESSRADTRPGCRRSPPRSRSSRSTQRRSRCGGRWGRDLARARLPSRCPRWSGPRCGSPRRRRGPPRSAPRAPTRRGGGGPACASGSGDAAPGRRRPGRGGGGRPGRGSRRRRLFPTDRRGGPGAVPGGEGVVVQAGDRLALRVRLAADVLAAPVEADLRRAALGVDLAGVHAGPDALLDAAHGEPRVLRGIEEARPRAEDTLPVRAAADEDALLFLAGLEDAALGVVFALGAAAPTHALRVLAVVARQALHAGAVVPAVGSGVGAVRVRLAGGVHHAALPGAGPAAHALAVGIAADGVRGIIGGVRAVAVGSGAGGHQLALVVRVAAVETEAARPGVQIAGVLLAVVARQAGRPVPGAGPAAGPAVAIGIVQARRDETAGHGRLAALHVAVRALGGELLGQVA